jgi:hypothetical protein
VPPERVAWRRRGKLKLELKLSVKFEFKLQLVAAPPAPHSGHQITSLQHWTRHLADDEATWLHLAGSPFPVLAEGSTEIHDHLDATVRKQSLRRGCVLLKMTRIASFESPYTLDVSRELPSRLKFAVAHRVS